MITIILYKRDSQFLCLFFIFQKLLLLIINLKIYDDYKREYNYKYMLLVI